MAKRDGLGLSAADLRARFIDSYRVEEERDRAAGWVTSEEREHKRWRTIVATSLRGVADPDACFLELYDHFARPTAWRVADDAAAVFLELASRGLPIGLGSNYDSRLLSVIDGFAALAPCASARSSARASGIANPRSSSSARSSPRPAANPTTCSSSATISRTTTSAPCRRDCERSCSTHCGVTARSNGSLVYPTCFRVSSANDLSRNKNHCFVQSSDAGSTSFLPRANNSSNCLTTPRRDRAAISKLVWGENSLKCALKYSAARRIFGSLPRKRRGIRRCRRAGTRARRRGCCRTACAAPRASPRSPGSRPRASGTCGSSTRGRESGSRAQPLLRES